jgi:hypothetical protein
MHQGSFSLLVFFMRSTNGFNRRGRALCTLKLLREQGMDSLQAEDRARLDPFDDSASRTIGKVVEKAYMGWTGQGLASRATASASETYGAFTVFDLAEPDKLIRSYGTNHVGAAQPMQCYRFLGQGFVILSDGALTFLGKSLLRGEILFDYITTLLLFEDLAPC